MTEVVGFDNEAEVAKVVEAVSTLEAYSKDILTLQQFRQASSALVSNLVVKMLTGEYGEPRNMKEAADIALKISDLVTKHEMAQLGDDLSKIDDPEERRRVFEELRAQAKKAAVKK
jgi:Zn-dependent M32 family carboxypeptidase